MKQNENQLTQNAKDAAARGQYAVACKIYLDLHSQGNLRDDGILNFAIILEKVDQPARAISLFSQVSKKSESYPDAQFRCGKVFQRKGHHEQAVIHFSNVIKAQPDYVPAYNSRANSLGQLSQFRLALDDLNNAIDLAPINAHIHYNRGSLYSMVGKFQDAIKDYTNALKLDKTHFQSLNNRAIAYRELGMLEEALDDFQQALGVNKECKDIFWNQGLTLMLAGEFEKALPLLEFRWKSEKFRDSKRIFTAPKWTGQEPLGGKTILLHSEQGLGDSIQFCRYINLFKKWDCKVLLEVETPLISIMSSLVPSDQIYSKNTELPDFDYHCPLMSLAWAFDTNEKSIPAETPYITVDQKVVHKWARKLGKKERPRIGFCWQGNKLHQRDKVRSLPITTLLPHLHYGFDWICLQKELTDEDRIALNDRDNVISFGHDLGDFQNTAGLFQNLDAVLSVDTSMAHLAGALAIPLHLLLSYVPDARWHLNTATTAWYPTAILHRQTAPNDWNSPVKTAIAAINHRFWL